jgi:hypothetical protein
MFRSLDRTAHNVKPTRSRAAKIAGVASALAMTAALAGCVSDVPPPIVPPPIYSQQPAPVPVYPPPGAYYVQPAPQAYYYPAYPAYPRYYEPCCATSLSFGYSSGWHRGGGYHHWH